MSHPQPAPPSQLLQQQAHMLAEMVAMHREQAVVHQEQLDKLAERKTRNAREAGRDHLSLLLRRQCGWPLHLLGNFPGRGRGIPVGSRRMGTGVAAADISRVPDRSSEPASRGSFKDICHVVQDHLSLCPEFHRQRFSASRLTEEDRPFAFAQQLQRHLGKVCDWMEGGTVPGLPPT